jgi:hypothetical protein
MIYNINDNNLFEHITKHDRVIWFFFRKGQEKGSLELKPNCDIINEVNEEFSGVTFYQTTIEDNPKILEYFNLLDENIWDYNYKNFNPRIISIKDGQKIYDQSGDKCYCLETLLEMIFDLYSELIPIPTSEG